MPQAVLAERTPLDHALDALLSSGRAIFALAVVALGIETFVVARVVSDVLGSQYRVLPVLPWLPAIPWLAYLFGAMWILCGAGLLSARTLRTSALVLGALLFVCGVILDAPKYVPDIASVPLRTIVFEPVAMACLAWLMAGPTAMPRFLTLTGRYLLAASLIIFGADHFLVLAFIATLLPSWIPWHVFWVVFFGVAFIAGGISIAINFLQRWAAAGLGLMFGIWVLTLHLPRVLGLYGIPNAPRDPDEYSSLFIAVALWGGLWALASVQPRSHASD